MTIDQIIALAASVGACMAAIATFLTVLQISKQRKATYRPQLALSRVMFEGSNDATTNEKLPSLWTHRQNSAATKDTADNHFGFFSVPLANIGLGAAKNVTISWTFPLGELVGELNKRAQRTLTPAYFTLENGIFSLKSEKFGQWSSMWTNQQKDSIDYLLSASIQSEAFMLRLPHAYIASVSSMLALGFGEAKESFPEIPNLTARFEYSDIADDVHEAVFEIEFHLVMIGNSGQTISGYLEFKKRA